MRLTQGSFYSAWRWGCHPVSAWAVAGGDGAHLRQRRGDPGTHRAGQGPAQPHDIEQAQESFAEAIEIADLLIPGRDNVSLNPLRQPHTL